MAITLRKIKFGLAIHALFGYRVSVVVLGLFLHPYQTVQDIVRNNIPVTSILFPSLCWLAGFLLLRFIEHFVWLIFPFLGFWWFLFVWGTSFLCLWQMLLLYLYIRFSRVI